MICRAQMRFKFLTARLHSTINFKFIIYDDFSRGTYRYFLFFKKNFQLFIDICYQLL